MVDQEGILGFSRFKVPRKASEKRRFVVVQVKVPQEVFKHFTRVQGELAMRDTLLHHDIDAENQQESDYDEKK
jgi:hypothetical protein